MGTYLIVVTVIFSLVTIFVSLVLRQPDLAFQIDRWVWAKPLMWLSGIEVEYREGPDLPKTGFLYLFNHTSYNDIIAMIAALKKPPKFGAKAELFKIPFFGLAMRSLEILPIHRDQRERVLQMYKEAKSRVQKGEHFALAPEGTRQLTDQLGKFKKGPFLFAIHAEMPIMPLVIAGARQTQPKGSWLINLGAIKRKIIIQAVSPIDTSCYSEDSLTELQEKVREHMTEVYDQLKSELKVSDFESAKPSLA